MGPQSPKISPSPKQQRWLLHTTPQYPPYPNPRDKLQEIKKNKKGKASKLAVIDIIIKLAVVYSIILLI